MTKLRQKLQISHSDVIRSLRSSDKVTRSTANFSSGKGKHLFILDPLNDGLHFILFLGISTHGPESDPNQQTITF